MARNYGIIIATMHLPVDGTSRRQRGDGEAEQLEG